MIRPTLIVAAGLLCAGLVTGCAQPVHLQYDYGRAFNAALAVQSDLERPSAAHSDYPLSGIEGLELRQRVIEQSTDSESGEAKFIDSFEVQ